jgi:hypothetical protein
MNTLSDSQTDLIAKWVKSHHLTIHSLENEFIDHICCDVEELMNEGKSFKTAFENPRNELGDECLSGFENQENEPGFSYVGIYNITPDVYGNTLLIWKSKILETEYQIISSVLKKS